MGTALYLEGTDRTLTITESSAVADGPGWWPNFREIRSREAADDLGLVPGMSASAVIKATNVVVDTA